MPDNTQILIDGNKRYAKERCRGAIEASHPIYRQINLISDALKSVIESNNLTSAEITAFIDAKNLVDGFRTQCDDYEALIETEFAKPEEERSLPSFDYSGGA